MKSQGSVTHRSSAANLPTECPALGVGADSTTLSLAILELSCICSCIFDMFLQMLHDVLARSCTVCCIFCMLLHLVHDFVVCHCQLCCVSLHAVAHVAQRSCNLLCGVVSIVCCKCWWKVFDEHVWWYVYA